MMTEQRTVTQGVNELAIEVGTRLADVALLSETLKARMDAVLTASIPYQAVSATPTATRAVAVAEPTDLRHLAGMDCNTGKLIRGIDYLRQRIADALLTPIGSQCLLRARGSNLLNLIDQPMNSTLVVQWIADIADVLGNTLAGVPDFVLTRVKILTATVSGQLGLQLSGQWLGTDIEVTI